MAHLPIIFEVVAPPAEDVTITLSSPASPFSAPAGTVATVSAGETQTVKIWVTYVTGVVGVFHEAILNVSASDGSAYEVLFRAGTSAYEPTQLALVLDCSTSMDANRGDGVSKLQGLIAASKAIVDLCRDGDGIGVARFSTNVIAPSFDVAILPAGRVPAKNFIDGLATVGATSIGDGLSEGRDLLAADLVGTYARSALLVVTDGKENAPAYISTVAPTLASPTYAIGIGMPNDINVTTLQVLTGNLGGYLVLTGDPVGPGNQYVLEKFLFQALATANYEDLVVDPEGLVVPGVVERVPFSMTEADLGFEAVVFTDHPERLEFALQTPDGHVWTSEDLSAWRPGSFVRGERVAYFRLGLPAKGRDGRHVPNGNWQLLMAIRDRKFSFARGAGQSPPQSTSRGKPAPYCATVSVRSAVHLKVDIQQKEPAAGSPFLIEALLTAFGKAWSMAQVVAELRGPAGLDVEVQLKEAEPGRFFGTFTPVRPGLYHARVRARGRTLRDARFQREFSLTVAVLPLGSRDGNDRPPEIVSRDCPPEARQPRPCGPGCHAVDRVANGLNRIAEHLRRKF